MLQQTSHNESVEAQYGDIVTIDLDLRPENGFVPESLFDTQGIISFVLGWGNYLPGLHQLVEDCRAGDEVRQVSIDAGYGGRSQDLILTVPRSRILELAPKWTPETKELTLGGALVAVVSCDANTVTIDANPPLAGSSYSCSFRVLAVERGLSQVATTIPHTLSLSQACPDRYQMAVFALGCYWGAELAFARTPGVVATRVGYTHADARKPREAVVVIFDQTSVSYCDLVHVALARSWESTDAFVNAQRSQQHAEEDFGLANLFVENDDDEVDLYKNAIYYQNECQRQTAQSVLKQIRYNVDLLPATTFKEAEDHDQHYLFKGGQSTRKNEKAKIRCFG